MTMSTRPIASGKKRKLVNVYLLDGCEHIVFVDVKSKFQEVYNQVTGHLSLRETEYFGLAFKKDNEYQFVVLDEKIHKHAPKNWKSGPGEGVDSQGKAIVNVWFRVQFYVDQVILLREKVTRHQYYLQLKDNVLQHNHLYNEEKCIQLAAYALQADFGNFVKEKHERGYFNPALYFPQWILERHGLDYLAQNVPALHKDLHNMTRNDAELRYIRNASVPPGALNIHFYMVRRRKTDKTCNTWLAICAKGVEVYEDDAGYKNHVSTFLWRDIGKLYFDKKKFEIRSCQSAGGRRFIYYTDCDIKSKYLLSICRGTHMFQMAIQPKLMEIQHLDNEDQKRYRESYVSTDPRDRSHFQHSPSMSISASGSSHTQRLSMVSDASSNTTSGIVSDRNAASFDDGDDHAREIMIDCPPRLPRQMRSKLKLFSSFNHNPPFSAQASPSLSLEVNKNGTSGSSQELTSTPSGGSWRARHSPAHGCYKGTAGLPLPSPTTHTMDNKMCLQVGRGAGHKDSYGKLLHGSLLQTGDRNASGDSAVSVSGIFTGQEKFPLSLLPSVELQPSNVISGDGVTPGISGTYIAGRGVSSAFTFTPPMRQLANKTNDPNPPPTLNFISSPASKTSCPKTVPSPTKTPSPLSEQYQPVIAGQQYQPVIAGQQYRVFSGKTDVIDKLNSPRIDMTQEYGKSLGSSRTGCDHVQYKAPDSSHELSKVSKTLISQQEVSNEPLKLSVPCRGMQSYPGLKSETGFSPLTDVLQAGPGGRPTAQSVGPNSNNPLHVVDRPYSADALQHIVTAQVHQSAEPQMVHIKQPAQPTATEHYLMALQQQSSDNLMEHWGGKQVNESLLHQNSVSHVQEHHHQAAQYQPVQEQQQQQIELQQHCEYKPQNTAPQSSVQTPESDYAKEMDENKENLYQIEKNEEDRKIQTNVGVLQTHGKANLHPELKQILGQSHAFSLPLMTALCNDSSLMQASRSQSGSRSSYDTSTVRSTDSRLTRFSHDTDSRRWSSCCHAANMPEVMMSVQSARPYSWHSEHFELDSQLALPSVDHLPPTSPPNPRSLNNKHLNMLNNHQNILPQKMIVSDPGPSSPRMMTTSGGTCWWDSPARAIETYGTSPSWTDVIPYSLPTHQQQGRLSGGYGGSQQLNSQHHHQQLVPHKLSSGGLRDSETSITHKQVMKENIGIA